MFNLNEGLWYYIVNVANNGLEEWKIILLSVSFAFISIAAGYLLGSINSAIIVSKLLYGDDVRRHGSGNAGMTNMLRTYGKKAAVLTLVGDLLKTVVAIVIGSVLGGFGYVGGISVGGACVMPLKLYGRIRSRNWSHSSDILQIQGRKGRSLYRNARACAYSYRIRYSSFTVRRCCCME